MSLEGFSISCSKFHLSIYLLFSCIQFIPFGLFISYIYLSSLSNERLCNYFSSRIILSRSHSSYSSTSSSMFSCGSSFTIIFSFYCRMISTTPYWMIALFYFCIPKLFLVAGSRLRYLFNGREFLMG